MENNEIVVEKTTVAKKARRIPADAIFLIFIVLLTFLALTGFTFLRKGTAVLSGEQAIAEQTEASTPQSNISKITMELDEEGNVTVSDDLQCYDEDGILIDESAEGNEDIFAYVGYGREDEMSVSEVLAFNVYISVDEEGYTNIYYVRHDAQGNVILDQNGEPIIDYHHKKYGSSGAVCTVNLDEVFGLVGVETNEDMVQNALEAKNKTAYAGNAGCSVGDNREVYYNSAQQVGWDIQADAYGSQYNGGGFNLECYCVLSITGGVWSRWAANCCLVVYAYEQWWYSGDCDAQWIRAGFSHGYRSDNNEQYNWSGIRSWNQYNFYVCKRSHTPGASCATRSCTSYIWARFYAYHDTYNMNYLGYSWGLTNGTWAHYRNTNEIYVDAWSYVDYLRYFMLRFINSGWAIQESGNWGGLCQPTAQYRNNGPCYGNLWIYYLRDWGMQESGWDVYPWSGRSCYSYGCNMYIDNRAPGITLYGMYSDAWGSTCYQSGYSTTAGPTYIASQTTTIYLLCDAWDSSDGWYNGASGVKRVYATRNGSYYGQFSFLGQGTSRYYLPLYAQDANAYWVVYVEDNTSGWANSVAAGIWISAIDCYNPWCDSNVTVNISQTQSNAGGHWSVYDTARNNGWSSAPLYCSINIWDRTGSTYYGTDYYKRAGIAYIYLRYWYNNSWYSYLAAWDSSVNENDVVRIRQSNYSYVGWSNTDTMQTTVSFYMPYDSRYTYADNWGNKTSTPGFTLIITDFSGHQIVKNCTTGNYHIDTVAPQITSVSIDKGGSSWTNGAPTLTVKAQDYNGSYGTYGNYSGLYGIFVYGKDPRSYSDAPLWQATSCTTVSTGNNTSTITKTFNITSKAINGGVYKDSVALKNYNGSTPTLYIVAIDWAGNRSDSYNGYNRNSSNNYGRNHSYNSTQFNGNYPNYYAGNYGVPTQTVYYDLYNPPVVEIFADSGLSQKIAASNGSGANTTYCYPYVKGRGSISFYIRVTVGASGGTLNLSGGTSGSVSISDYRYNGYGYGGSSGGCKTQTTGNVKTVTISTQGEATININFTGGSGNKATQSTIKTRIDTVAPSISLKGFYTSAPSTAAAVNSPNYSEATLATGSWTKNALYAMFALSDSASGLNKSASYGIYGYNGSSYGATQQSNASIAAGTQSGSILSVGDTCKYSVGFKYTCGSNTYSRTFTGTYVAIGSAYYLRIQLFNMSDMSSLKANGSGRTMLQGTTDWDITSNTFLQYQFTVNDFIGNSATYASKYYNGKQNSSTSTWVSYKVDPFPLRGSQVAYEVTTGKASDLVAGKTLPVSGKTKDYNSDWTKNPIVVKVTVQPTLSGGGTPQMAASSTNGNYSYNDSAGQTGKETISAGLQYWYRFENGTRNVYVNTKLTNGVGSSTTLSPILLKQDTVAPVITGVYLTATNSPTATKVLYFDATKSGENYTFTLNTSLSTQYALSGENNKYVSGSNTVYFTWQESRLYLFYKVTDRVNNFDGSGVATYSSSTYSKLGTANMTYGSTTANNPVYRENSSGSSSNDLYTFQGSCASTTTTSDTDTKKFGYEIRQQNYQYTLTITDKVGNSTTCKIGGAANTSTSNIKYSMLPFVDSVNPFVKLDSTNSVAYSATSGNQTGSYTYTSGGRNYLLGYNETNGQQYYTKTDLTVKVKATVGISGYHVYVRKRTFREALSANTSYTALSAYTVGHMPANYDYAGQGWGSYVNKSWVLSSSTSMVYANSCSDSAVSFSLAADDIFNRFDVLIVTGTNKYYLIEAGDVIMDRTGPTFFNTMTFFTKGTEGTATSVNYNTFAQVVQVSDVTRGKSWSQDKSYRNYLYSTSGTYRPAYQGISSSTQLYTYQNLVWPYAQLYGTQGYTNGKVYAYFYVEDICGVNDAMVKNNSAGSALTKVAVTVPVYCIDNVATKILYQGERVNTYAVASSATNGKYVIKETYYNNDTTANSTTTRNITTDITFVSSAAKSITVQNKSFTFYRLAIDSANITNVKISGEDMLGNIMNQSTVTGYDMKFDITQPEMTVTTEYNDAQGGSYASVDSNKKPVYTNRAVKITAKVSTIGNSGIGYILMTEKIKTTSAGAETTATKTIAVPSVTWTSTQITVSNVWKSATALYGNKTYSKSSTQTEVLLTVAKVGSDYYWYVNGTKTDMIVYNADKYYGGIITYNMTIRYASANKPELIYAVSKNVGNDRNATYTFTAYNGVISGVTAIANTDKKSKALSGSMYLDYTAPTIDTTTDAFKYVAAPYKCETHGYLLDDPQDPDTVYSGGVRYCKQCQLNGKNVAVSENSYSVPRLLEISVADNLSGIGTQISNGAYSFDKITYKYVYNNTTYEGYFFNNFTKTKTGASDGIYRPVDSYSLSNGSILLNDLMYCGYKVQYNITVSDKAGNSYTVSFTPNVDDTVATIDSSSTLSVKDPSGKTSSVKSMGLYNLKGTNGEIGSAYTAGDWTSNGVILIGQVTYGSTGVVLQLRGNQSEIQLSNTEWGNPLQGYSNVIAGYSNWTSLLSAGSGYYIYSITAVNSTTNRMVFGIPFAGSNAVTALYQYNSLRAISRAAYNEGKSGECTIAEVVTDSKNKISNSVMRYNKKACSAIGNGLYWLSESQESKTLDRIYNTGLISIDKVTPTIGMSVLSSGKTYGSSTGYVWTCTEGVWVNQNVIISLSTTQVATPTSLNFASGNEFYFTTSNKAKPDVKDANPDYTDWYKVTPDGKIYSYSKASNDWAISYEAPFSIEISLSKQSITSTDHAEIMKCTLSTDQNNTTYRYFVKSGANLSSEVFTVKNICLDTKTPSVTINAKSSYDAFEMGADGYKLVNASDYNSATGDVATYTSSSSEGSFTCKNSVILQVEVKGIGASAVELYIKIGNNSEKLILSLKEVTAPAPLGSGASSAQQAAYNEQLAAYNTYLQNKAKYDYSGNNPLYFYIAITGNLNQKVTVTAQAVAYDLSLKTHKTAQKDAYVRIDNTVPFVYVTDISSENGNSLDLAKASNWEVAKNDDKWYISTIAFKVRVATIQPTLTAGGDIVYKYSTELPKSDYTVYYRISYYKTKTDSEKTQTEWTSIKKTAGTATLELSGTILYYSAQIEFKVVSGSEYTHYNEANGQTLSYSNVLHYELGSNSIDGNRFSYSTKDGLKSEEKINTIVYNNGASDEQLTMSQLQTRLGAITGHTIDGVIDQNGSSIDNTFIYQMNIDTYLYNYTYKAQLLTENADKEENKKYNKNTTDLVTYNAYIGDWKDLSGNPDVTGGQFTKIDPTQNLSYHHGDIIRIEYETKVNGSYYYFHDYTKADGGNIYDVSVVNTSEYYGDKTNTDEKTGSFSIVFETNDVHFVSEMGAELQVTYDSTNFYIQLNKGGAMVTTGIAEYVWNTTEKVKPNVTFTYFDIDGNPLFNGASFTADSAKSQELKTVGAYYVVPYIAAKQGKNGNFRVKVRDRNVSKGEERQTFVVKYFNEELIVEKTPGNYEYSANAISVITENYTLYMPGTASKPGEDAVKAFLLANAKGHFVIYTLEDFMRIEQYYYEYDDATDTVTKYSYLNNIGDFTYKLMSDLELTKDFHSLTGGAEEAFTLTMEGNGKTITLSMDEINGDYGIFDRFAGTVSDLQIVAGKTLYINIDATKESETNIGLLAKIMTGGTIANVSVTADMELQGIASSYTTNIGGIAGKAMGGTLGEVGKNAVYTDIRVTNKGASVKNTNVGGMFGTINGVNFTNAIAFGDITVYNVNASSIGIGMVAGSGIYGAVSELSYFNKNTFLNDETVYGATKGQPAVGVATSYDIFAHQDNATISSVSIAGKTVRERILKRLYQDFYGVQNATSYDYGTGVIGNGDDIPADPLLITTKAQFLTIDKYVNLSYKLNANLDLSDYTVSVAVHKVFNGVFDGDTGTTSYYYLIDKMATDLTTYGGQYFGLFGQVDGTVKNLVFTNLAISLKYTGSQDLHAGVVAGKMNANANINNIIMIGTMGITCETINKVYVGSVVGKAVGGKITDVFNMNNMTVNANYSETGGIVGHVEGTKLSDTTGYIYSLGRVEVNRYSDSAASVVMGSIIGDGSYVTNVSTSHIFFITHNTYVFGISNNDLTMSGSAIRTGKEPKAVDFSDNDMRNNTSFERVPNVFTLIFTENHEIPWYPLTGAGLSNNPFIVEDEEDFKNINIALYAFYKITNDIDFKNFTTVGYGLDFTGTIDGSGKSTGSGEGISAEVNNLVSLTNVTGPLVYNIKGAVQNIIINTKYKAIVETGETLMFGAVAVYSSGNIKNITVQGSVDITGVDYSTTVFVSGYVAICEGGSIEDSKLRNAISALNIVVRNVGAVYTGGFAAAVQNGEPVFSFGIASSGSGSEDSQSSQSVINIVDCGNNIIAGLLVGQVYSECSWQLALSEDYYYTIIVNGVAIKKTDEDGKIIHVFGKEN